MLFIEKVWEFARSIGLFLLVTDKIKLLENICNSFGSPERPVEPEKSISVYEESKPVYDFQSSIFHTPTMHQKRIPQISNNQSNFKRQCKIMIYRNSDTYLELESEILEYFSNYNKGEIIKLIENNTIIKLPNDFFKNNNSIIDNSHNYIDNNSNINLFNNKKNNNINNGGSAGSGASAYRQNVISNRNDIILYLLSMSGVRIHFDDYKEEFEKIQKLFPNCIVCMVILRYGKNHLSSNTSSYGQNITVLNFNYSIKNNTDNVFALTENAPDNHQSFNILANFIKSQSERNHKQQISA